MAKGPTSDTLISYTHTHKRLWLHTPYCIHIARLHTSAACGPHACDAGFSWELEMPYVHSELDTNLASKLPCMILVLVSMLSFVLYRPLPRRITLVLYSTSTFDTKRA